MSNILITGVNGFVGLNLAEFLYKSGHNIYGIGRQKKTNLSFLKEYYSLDISKIRIIENDLKKIDIIYHLATETQHHVIEENFFETFNKNTIAITNLLETAIKCNVERIIFSSSGKVYGKKILRGYLETDNLQPNSKLGILKKNQENILKDCSNIHKINIIIARIFNVYGPYQKHTFVVPTILKQLANDFVGLGNMNDVRDYIYITDLVSALSILNNNYVKNHINIYNIGSEVQTTVKDLISEFEIITNKKIKVRQNKKKLRIYENDIEYSNCKKLKKLGWEPTINLNKGLANCYKMWSKGQWM